VIATDLTTIVFLCQLHHPEDGWITGRIMLLKILEIKNKITVHLLVGYTFYGCSVILPFNCIVELIHGQNW
jgi:hypothetical protein